MAGEKTYIELAALIDAGIKVNGNREITPPIHNAIEKAISNSSLNKKDGGTIESIIKYITDPTFTDDKQIVTKKYVDDSISGITSVNLNFGNNLLITSTGLLYIKSTGYVGNFFRVTVQDDGFIPQPLEDTGLNNIDDLIASL